ncbi:MAG: hypothetical protein ACYS8Y_07155 [Planctomycetota bacterium]|jgi:hypothetical protein
MNKNIKIKFWILIVIAILLTVIYLIGQTMAFINYDFTVAIELQEPIEEITEVGVALNKGFGLGDTIAYIPLLILGIVGMIKRKCWGLFSMSGALAITIYWPIVCLSTLFFAKGAPGFHFSDYISYSILLTLISIYGLWGLLFIYKNRNELTNNTP